MSNDKTYEGMLEQVKAAAGDKAEAVVSAIKGLGGETADDLMGLTEGDLTGVGMLLLKARVLLRKWHPTETEKPATSAAPAAATAAPVQMPPMTVMTAATPDMMGDEELLARYDPERHDAFHTALKQRYPQHAFVVPTAAGTVDSKRSLERLKIMVRGLPVESTVDVDGRPVKPCKIGEPFTPAMAHRNPLYPDKFLCAPNDTCDVTGESYKAGGEAPEVSLEARQFLYWAVSHGQLEVRSPEEARIIIGRARKGYAALSAAHKVAAAAFDKLSQGERPVLEMQVGTSAAEDAPRGPFRGAEPYTPPYGQR